MSVLQFGRRHGRRWYPFAILVVIAMIAGLTAGISGAVNGSPSSFESNDGNMTLDTANNTDWNCFIGQPGFVAGTPPTGCATNVGATQVTADSNGEIEWVNGQKFDTQCPVLTTGNNPPKDEFTNVASFNETGPAPNFDVFFYGATIRPKTQGNVSGDVELNQNAGNGTTSAGCRTAGDRLIAYDFLNGGTSLNFHVLTWIDSNHPGLGGNNGTCFVKTDVMPCWGFNVIVPTASSDFDGEANQSQIKSGDNGINGATLAADAFAEFGINLSKVLGIEGQCVSFPQEVWESRSSGSSFTSNPEDIEIESHKINNCGEIQIIKQSDPRGAGQVFSYTSDLPANSSAGGVGSSPCTAAGVAADGSFCLTDAGNAGKTAGSTSPANNSTGNTVDDTFVPQGQYTVTEGTEPSGFQLEGLTCSADGTSGSSAQTSGASATITLKPQGVVTCIYTNEAQGEITIVKQTDPRGINQTFNFSSNILNDTAFSLNDSGNTTANDAANTNDTPNLAVGPYNVTETQVNGWTLESLHCTATGTGSSGSQDGTTALQADITLAAGGHVTCTYVNKAPSGAILITKTGKDKNCVSSSTPIGNGVCTGAATADLNGATFSITGTDLLGNAVTKSATSSGNGTACVDGLPWNGTGTSYSVTETGAPAGYGIDNTSAVSVKVIQNASCSEANIANEAALQSFSDTPLTNLSVHVGAVVAGSTNSSISCSNSSSAPIGNSPQPATGNGDPETLTANGLKPGTYTCTVVVDP